MTEEELQAKVSIQRDIISKANYQIYKDVTELTLAGYIAYLQGMYKRYGNISIAQLKHIERNRKKEDNQ